MKDYIGIILLESELAKCVDNLSTTQLRYQLGELGFDNTQVTEEIDTQTLVHNLIFDAIRNQKMGALTHILWCMPIQSEDWLHWANIFDSTTSHFDFDNVLAAMQAAPQVTTENPTTARDWDELSKRLSGDELYLTRFYLAAMYGWDFDFTSLTGEDEEARSHSLIAKCVTECKLVALLTVIDEIGAAGMPYLQNLVASWQALAIAEDRKCG